MRKKAAENAKRVVHLDGVLFGDDDHRRSQSAYAVFDFQGSKAMRHPIGM